VVADHEPTPLEDRGAKKTALVEVEPVKPSTQYTNPELTTQLWM
jgi:hypothetical protein